MAQQGKLMTAVDSLSSLQSLYQGLLLVVALRRNYGLSTKFTTYCRW